MRYVCTKLLMTLQIIVVFAEDMANRFFEGAAHAAVYAKFRPQTPKTLTDRVISYLKEEVCDYLFSLGLLLIDLYCTGYFDISFGNVRIMLEKDKNICSGILA